MSLYSMKILVFINLNDSSLIKSIRFSMAFTFSHKHPRISKVGTLSCVSELLYVSFNLKIKLK